jgi:hypothetical protein
MAQPSPLSAPCAADEVAAATDAGSRAESFVIVNGSDQPTSSVRYPYRNGEGRTP